MFAHTACDASTRRIRCCDVSTVANMPATTSLIGTHVVGAEDGARFLGNEDFLVCSHPIGKSLCPAQVTIKRIGFSRSDHGLDD